MYVPHAQRAHTMCIYEGDFGMFACMLSWNSWWEYSWSLSNLKCLHDQLVFQNPRLCVASNWTFFNRPGGDGTSFNLENCTSLRIEFCSHFLKLKIIPHEELKTFWKLLDERRRWGIQMGIIKLNRAGGVFRVVICMTLLWLSAQHLLVLPPVCNALCMIKLPHKASAIWRYIGTYNFPSRKSM